MPVVIFCIGLLFAYFNGVHDGGNVAATMIASRTLTPKKAILIAGCCNFAGGILLGTAVARTIAFGIVDQSAVYGGNAGEGYIFVLSAILGGFFWNLITWKLRMPSSSSHALIGGLIGAGIAAYGIYAVLWPNVLVKVVLAMVLSPTIGLLAGMAMIRFSSIALKHGRRQWHKRIRVLQGASMTLLALVYGGNDAQKSMGVIVLGFVFSTQVQSLDVPLWVRVSCAATLALGTITGGYNMIRTIGMSIMRVRVIHSFASQFSSMLVVLAANIIGAPISTTQVIISSVMGAGSGDNPKYVNWAIVKKILTAWILTIPMAGLLGGILFFTLRAIIL